MMKKMAVAMALLLSASTLADGKKRVRQLDPERVILRGPNGPCWREELACDDAENHNTFAVPHSFVSTNRLWRPTAVWHCDDCRKPEPDGISHPTMEQWQDYHHCLSCFEKRDAAVKSVCAISRACREKAGLQRPAGEKPAEPRVSPAPKTPCDYATNPYCGVIPGW
jgi:hypothetical protein